MLTTAVIVLGMVVPAIFAIRHKVKMHQLEMNVPYGLEKLMVSQSKYYLMSLMTMILSILLLKFLQSGSLTGSIVSGVLLIGSMLNSYFDTLLHWNPLTIQHVFTKKELTALENIRRELIQKLVHNGNDSNPKPLIRPLFTNQKSVDIKSGAYAVDGKGFDEFGYQSITETEFEEALRLKEKLEKFLLFQDAKYLYGATSEEDFQHKQLAVEINQSFKKLRQSAGTIQKSVIEENVAEENPMLTEKIDPVLEDIEELLASKKVSEEKAGKLIELKEDILSKMEENQKFEESKKTRLADEEADAILVAGAHFHKIDKKYV